MLQTVIAVKIAKKRREALDICSFELVGSDGASLPPFGAGAHVDVHIRAGLVRQYSLCNHPSESHRYLIAVLREAASRGGSQAMHDEVHEGSLIHISDPRNHFPLAHEAQRSLLFAGGIGITPILCMAEQLAGTGADFEMHYCTRSKERTAFLERIRTAAFAHRVHFHFDDGPAGQRLDLALALHHPEPGTHVYVCGPAAFIDWVIGTAQACNWPAGQLHVEFFKAQVQPAATGAETFEVQIASTGKCYVVPPEKSILEVLSANGVDVPFSCEQGFCGTCVTRVLEGEPDHRDIYLTDEEHARNDQLTLCCSRSKSARLVLDI